MVKLKTPNEKDLVAVSSRHTRLSQFLPMGSLVIVCMLCPVASLFGVPGVFWLCFGDREKDLPTRLVYVCALSQCYWIGSFWFLKWIPLSLVRLFSLTVGATLVSLLFFLVLSGLRSMAVKIRADEAVVIGVFIVILGLRLLPLATMLAPAGADMSMHTYITALIKMANGIPGSYRPVLDIDTFDTFPVGFHTISAMIAIVGKMPPYRATFILTGITYGMVTTALYVLFRNWLNWPVALASAVCFTFLTKAPQNFAGWGGNPTVYALVFVVLFVDALHRLEESRRYVLPGALFLSAFFLSHTIIFIQAFYSIGIAVVVSLVANKRKITRSCMMSLSLLVAAFFVLVMPYLATLNPGLVTEPVIKWIMNWVRNSGHVRDWSIINFYWRIPCYIYQVLAMNHVIGTVMTVISGYGWWLSAKRKRDVFCFFTTFLVVCMGLILNSRYWILPFSYAIYPERVVIMMIIPLGIFFGLGCQEIASRAIGRLRLSLQRRKIIVATLVIMLVGLSGKYCRKKYIHKMSKMSSVTRSDLRAFGWLRRHTKPGDIVGNNYGDGGLWIPAIIHRQVTTPHVNVLYLDKLRHQGKHKPRYYFIGSKCVYKDSCAYKIAKLAADPSYRLVFESDGTAIFERN